MAVPVYDDGNYSPAARALKKYKDSLTNDAAVQANPVGPPALVAPPNVNANATPGVRVDPTATQLATDGVYRPASGPFSASNPQPMTDGNGALMMPRPVAAAPIPQLTPLVPPPGNIQPIAGAAPAGQLAQLVRPPPNIQPITPPTTPAFNNVAGAARSTAGTPALSDDGRPLGYGSTVNGVRTFTDADLPAINAAPSRLTPGGSGIGGNIAGAAMALTRPGAGVIANTPQLGSAEGYALSRPAALTAPVAQGNPVASARAANIEAQRYAASDAASIANRDPRSVLGAAARNADVEAASGFGGPGQRRAAYNATLNALNGAAASGIVPAAELGQTAVREAGDTARNAATNATSLANNESTNATSLAGDVLRRPQPNVTNLADGTAAVIGADGVARPVTDGRGGLVRPQIGKPPEDVASYNKALEARIASLLGVDPVSGLIPNKDGKGGRAPSAQELQSADAAARQTFNTGQRTTPSAPTKQQFMDRARAANPGVSQADLEHYYNTTYGG